MDYIGIQAYFPLSDDPGALPAALRRAWKEHLNAIEQVATRFGKAVIFTEIGYRSDSEAPQRPGEWSDRGPPQAVDLVAQKACYDAFFETVWTRP